MSSSVAFPFQLHVVASFVCVRQSVDCGDLHPHSLVRKLAPRGVGFNWSDVSCAAGSGWVRSMTS